MFSTRFLTEHALQMPPRFAASLESMTRRGNDALVRAEQLLRDGKEAEAAVVAELAFCTLEAAFIGEQVLRFVRYSAQCN